jgi:hypothetical protein
MTTEDYVSFETAKLLKEKGFESDECIAIYDLGDGNAFIRDSGIFDNGPEDYLEFQWGEEWKRFGYYLAPTLQMATKWLKENFNIAPVPYATSLGWYFEVFDLTQRDITGCALLYQVGIPSKEDTFNTFEEAWDASIRYCLENLI